MNNVRNIKNLFENNIQLAILLLFSYLSIFFIRVHPPYIYVNIVFFIILFTILLFQKHPLQKVYIWITIFIFLCIYIASKFYVRGNHVFVAAYVCLTMIIYCLTNTNEKILLFNTTCILAIILFFSGLHKLLSPEYRSGAYFSYMLNRGEFLWVLKYIDPSFKAITQENIAQLQLSAKHHPSDTAIPLHYPIPFGKQVSVMLSQASIYMELIAGLMILIKPKHWITHTILLATILGVATTRQEFGFLTMLCVGSLLIAQHTFFKVCYTLVAIGFMTLIIVRIGFL